MLSWPSALWLWRCRVPPLLHVLSHCSRTHLDEVAEILEAKLSTLNIPISLAHRLPCTHGPLLHNREQGIDKEPLLCLRQCMPQGAECNQSCELQGSVARNRCPRLANASTWSLPSFVYGFGVSALFCSLGLLGCFPLSPAALCKIPSLPHNLVCDVNLGFVFPACLVFPLSLSHLFQSFWCPWPGMWRTVHWECGRGVCLGSLGVVFSGGCCLGKVSVVPWAA